MSSQKYICLLCCKSFENSGKSPVSKSHQVLIETPDLKKIRTLFKSIGSVGLLDFSDFNLLKSDEANFGTNLRRNGICSDCEIVATAICDLHHEIKCLELRLDLRIDTLEEIMKLGGRVPSRLQHLKSHCDEIDKCLKNGENISYTKIDSVRRKLMKACSTRRSKTYPRIILRKHMKHESDSNSISAMNPKPMTEHSGMLNGKTYTINQIISLLLIIVIGLTTDFRRPCQFDTSDPSISTDHSDDFGNTDKPAINSSVSGTKDIENCSNISQSVDGHNLHIPVAEAGCEDGQSESSQTQSVVSTMPVAEDTQNDDDDCMEDASTEMVMEQNCRLRNLRNIITCKHCPKTFSNSRSLDFHMKKCAGVKNEMPQCDDDDNDVIKIEDHDGQFSATKTENEASGSDSDNSFTYDDDDVEVDAQPTAMLTQDQERLVRCKYCPGVKYCREGQGLSRHIHIAHKSKVAKTFQCKTCPGKIFNSLTQFRNHRFTYHRTDPKHFPFQCDKDECQLRYSTKYALRHHLKVFHGKRSKLWRDLRCRVCQKIFGKRETLELHKLSCRKFSSEKATKYLLTCTLCPGSRFIYPVKLRRHQRLLHGVNHDDTGRQDSLGLTVDSKMVTEDEPLPCEVAGCQQRFSLPQELENHSKMHGQFSCSMCSVVMNFAPDLAQHEADEHAKTEDASTSTKCQCPRCPFTLKCSLEQEKTTFMKHFLSTHLNLNWATLTCAICGFRYFTIDRRMRKRRQIEHFKRAHDISHMNPVDVKKCDQCPAYFKTLSILKLHKKIVHLDAKTKLKCGECGKEFKSRNNRRKHMRRVHNTHFSVACSIPGCQKTFPDQDDLSCHMEGLHKHEIVNGELKTYKCRKCGHISKGRLEHLKHVAGHNKKTEKRSFVCEQCGKAFKTNEKLHKHYLSHSGPDSWQFCCDICGRKFMTKQKLTEHGRTHTKEKPFQCSVCGEKYAHRHNLRNHVNKKHADIVQDIPRRFDKTNLTSRKRPRKMQE